MMTGVRGGEFTGRGTSGGALSAFDRNMADDMVRIGTLRRSAEDGFVVALAGDAHEVARALGPTKAAYRGRAHGAVSLVEFPSFSGMLDATLGCDLVPVPDSAFLDFADIAPGTIRPDPEEELALHAVFSALGQLVQGRPHPSAAPAPAPVRELPPLVDLRRSMTTDLPFIEAMIAQAGAKR